MVDLPSDTMRLVNDPRTSKTIATISSDGRIHTIWMGSLMSFSPDQLMFAHILMKRSQRNLEEMKERGDLVSVLVTLVQDSFEIMTRIVEYQTSGPTFEKMIESLTRLGVKESLDKYGLKVLGVWVLEPLEVWSQGPGPKAGTRIV